MKRLLILRHAKSDLDTPAETDFDRRLAPRGRRAAPQMGRYIDEQGLTPDLVLCSPALRARETWDLAATMLEPPPVELVPALYHASPHDILDELHRHGGEAASVCIIGHHPGVDGAALMLSGSGDQAALDRIRAKYPTAALAVLEAGIDDWPALGPGMAELKRFVAPRDFD